MAFRLSDIISQSAERSQKQLEEKQRDILAIEELPNFNVVTIEEQQRQSEQIIKKMEKTAKKEVKQTPVRCIQVKTRLSEVEKRYFDQRVQLSGLSQGDFMRQILLHETVEVHSITAADTETLEVLSSIAAELGKIGGLIRGTVIHDKGEFAVLSPQGKASLESQIRELNRLKMDIQKVVLSIYGNH